VLLRPGGGRSLVDARKEVVDLVALATAHQAAGVALDVYFTEPSPIDPLLCQVIDAAARSMPVVVGYGFAMQEGRVVEFGVPSTLQPCLPRERLAHLAGFLDFDLVSRLTPLFFRGDRTRPALGLAVATAVHRRSSDAGTRADDASPICRTTACCASSRRLPGDLWSCGSKSCRVGFAIRTCCAAAS
jgi:hypothetical protein